MKQNTNLRNFFEHVLNMLLTGTIFLALFSFGFSYVKRGNESETTKNSISENDFLSVPDINKPWVYYWWLNGNVSKELITRDLDEMAKKGIGGFLLFDSRGYGDGMIPLPLKVKYEFMSPEWREMVKFTMQEAHRLGLKMSINLANTGGSLRGPWDMKEDGSKQLIWTSGDIIGPSKLSVNLDLPSEKKYFKDVSLIAVKLKLNGKDSREKIPFDLNTDWKVVAMEPKDGETNYGDLVDLNGKLENGKLQWDVPEGEWRIFRLGYYVVGEKGSVDVLNHEAVGKYFHHMGEKILEDAGPLAGTTLTHFYNVSWEGEQANWTIGFLDEFKKYRGYDMFRYMPMLCGMIGSDRAEYDRFMHDYLRTVSDCFRNNCYKNIGELCHAHGMQWHSENGGPWLQREHPMYMFKKADQLAFWGENDMPQGEFWSTDSHLSNIRYAAMSAHVYGHPIVGVEAFTHMNTHWSKYPAILKPYADMNFVNGGNFFIWHTFTASPIELGKPGYEYWAGTHLNPNVTWWNQAGAFIEYLGRCQYMLRKGHFVAEACVYVSDNYNLNWGRGEKWNEKSSLTLGKGYTYDLISSESLINRLSVKDGNLILPDGMAYKLLVVDLEGSTIPEEVLKKIVELANNGATVVLGQGKPIQTAGLTNYPECDNKIRLLANQLWPEGGRQLLGQPFGKGKIYAGINMDRIMKDNGILPDFEGPFEYMHRSDNLQDIYFVSGKGKADCTFRIVGKKPEIWNPVSGKVSEVMGYRFTDDGRAIVSLDLPENGSVFVVFRKKVDKNYIVSIIGPDKPELLSRGNDSFKLAFWKGGKYTINAFNGDKKEVSVAVSPAIEMTGSWDVKFEPATGVNAIESTFEKLSLWNVNNNPAIKYFSGTASYKKSFSLTSEQASSPARLQLGEVHNIVRVWINGKDMGIVWTNPWTVTLNNVLKQGNNDLIIEVTNCWVNRLIGDARLPENERSTQTNVRLVPDRSKYKKELEAFSAQDSLLPSGLRGPVYVEFGKKQEIDL